MEKKSTEAKAALSIAGKTVRTKKLDEVYTWAFSKNGRVRISGTMAGDGIDAEFKQDGDKVSIWNNKMTIDCTYDGENLGVLSSAPIVPKTVPLRGTQRKMLKITIRNDYLNLPVKTGADKIKVLIRDADTDAMLHYFDIELGVDDSDFIGFCNIADCKGKEVIFEIAEGSMDESDLQASLQFSDAPLGLEGLYQEALRPQIHFTTRRGWINDPNGLVYYDGKYHLFYQHNPFGYSWGNMNWGQAVSDDMFHWKESDDALRPDAQGTMFSGSGVVDWKNSSGLGDGDHPPLCFFYTAAGEFAPEEVPFTQGLAYSLDNGRTIHKYEGNPIVPHIAAANRDPKVIWHEESRKWIMALYLNKSAEEQHYVLLRSDNLIDWRELQRLTLPGTGECPDFFPLPVDGTNDTKWVFWGADGHYLTGDFDGMSFTADGAAKRAYAGGEKSRGHAYAGQTWSDVGDGRRIHMAWIRGNIPGMPFNQQMSLPLEMGLRQTAAGLRLTFRPVGEFDALVSSTDEKTPGVSVIFPLDNKACRIHLTADAGGAIDMSAGDFSLELDAGSGTMRWGDESLPYAVAGDKLDMQLVFDRASLEIFGNDGLFYIALSRPGILGKDLKVNADKGIDLFHVSRLESIWQDKE